MVDLEAAERLGKELSEIESEGFRYYSVEIMETIRDLVAEVRRMQDRCASWKGLLKSHERVGKENHFLRLERDDARRQLASDKAEHEISILAALTTASNAIEERNEVQGKLTVAREALERIDKLKMECHELEDKCPVCIAETALIQIGGSDA